MMPPENFFFIKVATKYDQSFGEKKSIPSLVTFRVIANQKIGHLRCLDYCTKIDFLPKFHPRAF